MLSCFCRVSGTLVDLHGGMSTDSNHTYTRSKHAALTFVKDQAGGDPSHAIELVRAGLLL